MYLLAHSIAYDSLEKHGSYCIALTSIQAALQLEGLKDIMSFVNEKHRVKYILMNRRV